MYSYAHFKMRKHILPGKKCMRRTHTHYRFWKQIYSEMGFPGGSDGKESACNVGHSGSIPGSGRSPGGGHGNPLQYSCLENPHGQRSLAGYSPWSPKESDTTERLTLSLWWSKMSLNGEVPKDFDLSNTAQHTQKAYGVNSMTYAHFPLFICCNLNNTYT